MAFQEVKSTSEINTLKAKYRKLEREYTDKRHQFIQAVSEEDFEVLTMRDFIELKELYLQTKKTYWKIHKLEHPEDNATRKAYFFLNSMSHNDQSKFLRKYGLTTHRLIDAIRENPNYLQEVSL